PDAGTAPGDGGTGADNAGGTGGVGIGGGAAGVGAASGGAAGAVVGALGPLAGCDAAPPISGVSGILSIAIASLRTFASGSFFNGISASLNCPLSATTTDASIRGCHPSSFAICRISDPRSWSLTKNDTT